MKHQPECPLNSIGWAASVPRTCTCGADSLKVSGFSEFFHTATPEEKKKLILEVVKEASKQQKEMMDSPEPSVADWEKEFMHLEVTYKQLGARAEFSEPLLLDDEVEKVIIDFIRTQIALAREQGKREVYDNNTVIAEFTCSKHGKQKAEPKCPLCNDYEQGRAERTKEVVEIVEKIQYCSKCYSPKKFCIDWDEKYSAIDKDDLLAELKK